MTKQLKEIWTNPLPALNGMYTDLKTLPKTVSNARNAFRDEAARHFNTIAAAPSPHAQEFARRFAEITNPVREVLAAASAPVGEVIANVIAATIEPSGNRRPAAVVRMGGPQLTPQRSIILLPFP